MLLWVAVILGTGAGIYCIFLRFRKIRDGSTSRPRQPNNGTNPDEDLSSEAEDAWRRKDYERLLQLLEKDSPFPVGFSIEEVVAEQSIREQLKRLVEGRERLHEWISKGDFKSIKDYTKDRKPSVYYSTDNVRALSRALQCGKKDISSHFSEIMPKSSILEMAKENVLYSVIMEKPHLRQLVSVTKFSDEYSKDEFEAIITMYQMLEKHREISCLFKAIQNEDFGIIFAMKNEILETYEGGETKKSNGYTEKNGKIFIAGKGINTEEGKLEVYRVFAHEFCHLAMQFMYKNAFKPYLPHDEKRISAFSYICEDIHKKREVMDKLIQKVYDMYNKSQWHRELIVRIPEMMAFYGKENALQIFGKQTSELYKYYEEHIVKDCDEFSDRKFYSEELKKLKDISNDHLVVPNADICFPLFAKPENYEKYLVPWKARGYKFSFLPTSNPELGALQILYELEKLHADRRYLAFKLEHYSKVPNGSIISDAYDKSNAFEKLILVMPETKVNCNPERIFDDIYYGSKKEKEVIVVVSSELCDKFPEWKVKEKLQFNWNDLSEGFKNKLLEKSVVYQGIRTSLKVVFESVELTTDLLKNVMSDKEMCIGEALSSFGDEKDMYIERTFVRFVYNFQGEQMPSHYLFMTGVSEMTVNLKKWSQTLSKYDDEIEKGKYIFVTMNEKDNSDLFKNFCSNIKKKSKQVFWIHHTNGKYLLREPLERSEDIENYFVKETLDEYQMLKETDGVSAVLVADDPGSGKSTSITFLIEKMKSEYPEKLIYRVNFSEHLNELSDSLSLPSFLEVLQRVFKMNTRLEEMTFQEIIGVPQRVVVFFDGFDEMTNELRCKAMKTLQHLREKTQIQTWIFTRKHERLTLEEEMNIVSFSLRQFSSDDQLKYFNKFWLRSLISLYHKKKDLDEKFKAILKNLEDYPGKCEGLLESMKELVNLIEKGNQEEFINKIKDLDFSDYSKLVINSVKNSILKEKFIVPLWLWMMGNIILGSNFKIPEQHDRYTFYKHFMEEKVNFHLRNKCNMSSESKYQEKEFKRRRNEIFEWLWKFSDRVMRSEHYQEMPDMDEEYLQELVDVGLLRTEGEEYHFFHMTFAEFFFSQMFVEEIKSGNLHSVNVKLLSDILIKDSYREVRIFLDDFLVKDEIQSFIFPESLLKGFKLFEIYSKFGNRRKNRTGDWIWKRIFQSCELHMKESVDEDSILNVLKFSPFNEKYYLNGVLDVLNSTFTDKMLFIMFDSRVNKSIKFLFRCLQYIESNDLQAIMSIFEKIINYKESHLRSEVPSTSNSLVNIKVGLKIFEKEYKDELYGNSVLHLMTQGRKGRVLEDLIEIQSIIENEKLNKLLTMQNGVGETMLHKLMRYSEDPKDAIAVLEFFGGVMEGKSFKQFLTQKDMFGIFPISHLKLHIMKDVLVFMGRYFSKQYIIDMLTENKVRLGWSIVYTDCAIEEILCLEELLGNELFQEILISKDEYNGWTRLHYIMLMRADKLFVRDLKVYASFLDSDSMRDFLFSQDKEYGNTFLHWAGSQNFDIFRELNSILSPLDAFEDEFKDAFEELLNIRNGIGETFIHWYDSPISELYSFLVEFLEKEKLIKLVTDKNGDGWTRLHWIEFNDNYDVLFKDLKFYSEELDESSFRNFILTRNEDGETFCYKYKLSDLNKLKGILSPEFLLELQKMLESDSELESKRMRM